MTKINLPRMIAATGTKRRRFVIRNREPLKRDRDRLLAIYLRVVKHWESAIPRIVEVYERNARANGLLIGDAYRNRQSAGQIIEVLVAHDTAEDIVTEAIDSEASWFERVFFDLRILVADWAGYVEAYQRSRWTKAIFSATGVELDTLLEAGDVSMTVRERIAANLELVRDVNAQQRQRMAQAVYSGYSQRLSAREIAKELQAVTGFGRKRAMLIASDQHQKLISALDTERMHQAGVTDFIWRHSKKRHPRDWHKAREGKQYNLTTRVRSDGEETIPKDDMPGVPIRCGCLKESVIDLDAMERELEANGELMSQEELDRLMASE